MQVVECRHDWHQTGDQVNFTVYAKKVHPDRCVINCNPVKVRERQIDRQMTDRT